MLLNAGARSYALNNMQKSASEMAAFVGWFPIKLANNYLDFSGHFECVSMINRQSVANNRIKQSFLATLAMTI